VIHAALALDDACLELGRREVELERDEALARADLEVLEDVLVARVVGDDELKPGGASMSSPVLSTGNTRRSSVNG
jgi:hypothetical protein